MDCLLCKSKQIGIHQGLWQCQNCHLVFRDPQDFLDMEDEKNRYLIHENSIYDDSYLNYLNKLFVRAGIQKGLVLDYGCGPTKGLEGLAHKLSYKDLQVESYDPFFFPKEEFSPSYDLIYASECFEHFYHPDKELRFITKHLKESGVLAISTAFYDQKDFKTWHYLRDPSHVIFFSYKTFFWISETYGYKIKFLKSPHVILEKTQSKHLLNT